MTFTPKRGDYFRVSKLTDDQYREIVEYYEAQDFFKRSSSEIFSDKRAFLGCDEDGVILSLFEERLFGEQRRLLTYYDVFPEKNPHTDCAQVGNESINCEENQMIDWTKPIERSNGNFASFVKEEGGVYYCALHKNDDTDRELFISGFNADGTNVKGAGYIIVRNKPELIKPSGWVNVYQYERGLEFGRTHKSKEEAEDACSFHRLIATVSMEELLSGKYKDGFPVVRVSEDE